MIDDKGHDPGIAVMCRPRGQSETTDHLAADDVVGRTARRVSALADQHLEIVPVIGDSAARLG
jgi:hypothetical protein